MMDGPKEDQSKDDLRKREGLVVMRSMWKVLKSDRVKNLVKNPKMKSYLNEEDPMSIGSKQGTDSQIVKKKAKNKHKVSAQDMIVKINDINPETNSASENVEIIEAMNMIMKYVPACVYLSYYYNMANELSNIIDYMKSTMNGMNTFEITKLFDDGRYLFELLRSLAVLNEFDIHLHLLSRMSTVSVLMNEDVIYLYEYNFRFDFLLVLFRLYDSMLVQTSSRDPKGNYLDDESKDDGTKVTKRKLIMMIKKYFLCSPQNDIIMRIINKSIGDNLDLVVEILLESEEEERLIGLFDEYEYLLERLDYGQILKRRLFKMLILFDRSKLIEVFNSRIKDGEFDTHTVYEEICERISLRKDVEALTYVIIQAHDTFWDMTKLPKFHKALSIVFNNDDGNLNNREEMVSRTQGVLNSKSSWVVHVQNPLLFCIKLVYFFKQMKEQLDFKNRDIIEMSNSILGFCIIYTKNAGEDVLITNVFEKDPKGKDYMDYMFLVQDMSLVETDFIEGLIYEMWDLGRHTMQTIPQFMRLEFMHEDIDEFSLKVITKKYEMPIEKYDTFDCEYRFTSLSVYLKMISEIAWPILLIIVEFVFSLRTISIYKEGIFNHDWEIVYFERFRVSSYLLIYLRANFIVSNLLKLLLFKIFERKGFHHWIFFSLLNVLFILQMIVYPFYFHENFWLFCNLEMLIITTMIAYVIYCAHALNFIGVVLRIFFRMVFVVIIFGCMSCLIMLGIGYPIHVVYIDFSQVVDGALFPEQNVFRSLYNGILTLFEFLFGAVVFFRPYIKENLYSYTFEFIMVIFSFFGNIMMANILIAFLTRQLEEIRRNAKYYTNRMQYGLVKVFSMQQLDGIFSLPFPFVVVLSPLFVLMLSNGRTRRYVNGMLRKFTHIVNVFIPYFVYTNIKLILLMPIRYLQISLFIFVRIPVKLVNIVYFFVWMFAGLYLLLKLYILDVGTLLKIILNFEAIEDDFIMNPNLTEKTKNHLIGIFKKLERKAKEYLKDNEDEPVTTVSHFCGLLGIQRKKTHFRDMQNAVDFEVQEEEENLEDEKVEIGYSKKFNAKYSKEEKKIIPGLLKKFCMEEARTEEEMMNLRLDVELMVEKLQGSITIDKIQRLVGFDLAVLHKANKLINSNENTDVKLELNRLINKIKILDSYLNKAVSELEAVVDPSNN